MNYISNIINKVKKQNDFILYHLGVICVFTVIYYYLAKNSEEDKSNFKSLEDSLYYTLITHFTIGFGDVSPKSKIMRRFTMLQAVIAFMLMNI